MKQEREFKPKSKERIEEMFPGCFIHEMGCATQGIPDTLILFEDKWALLEFKKSKDASHRPNQNYYVNKFNRMGFSAFIYPENENEVLEELYEYFYGG